MHQTISILCRLLDTSANDATAIFTLVVISYTTPVFIALIFPLGALYLWIQRYYLRTSRELKRLDSISRSPIYAHFQESLSGGSAFPSNCEFFANTFAVKLPRLST